MQIQRKAGWWRPRLTLFQQGSGMTVKFQVTFSFAITLQNQDQGP
jgi:hypothetical protein